MKEHPYSRYEKLKTWTALKKLILELEKNGDIERKTSEEYIVGYLIKSLHQKGLLKEKVE